MRPETVIVVGNELPTAMPALLSSLESHGHRVIAVAEVEALPGVLADDAEAILLVYEEPGLRAAHRALEITASFERKVPVVVVTANGNFEDYYELMSEGAYDYFDLRDGAEMIERSVDWAAQAA